MTRPLLLTLAVLAMLGSHTATAATIPADSTAILSGAPSLFAPLPAPVADSDALAEAVSQDGRFVAFQSRSDGLSDADNDSVENIYVKDQLTGAVTFVSRSTGAGGAPAGNDCFSPAISDDGRRVAFVCEDPLDPADTNNDDDVYLRDLQTNDTLLVSRATQLGEVGDQPSEDPAVNGDGTRVAFESEATNFGGTTDGTNAIYVRDVPLAGPASSNTTTLVSRADGLNGALPTNDSFEPSISDDGNLVAFDSEAANLVAGDANGNEDVFVRTISTGATQLVSRRDTAAGALGNDDSFTPSISGDGTVVAFQSGATNLDDLDTKNDQDVYRRVLATQDTSLVDKSGGAKIDGEAGRPAVDDTGAAIAFSWNTVTADPADGNPEPDVYVAKGGTVKLASRGDGGAANTLQFPSISGDGTHVVFATLGSLTGDAIPGVRSVEIRDLAASSTTTVSEPGAGTFDNQGGESEFGSVSADGRFVAFSTKAPALGTPAGVTSAVVVRDTQTGAIVLASREDGPNGAPMPGFSSEPSISADGRRVAFTTDPTSSFFEVAAAAKARAATKRRASQRGAILGGQQQAWVRDLVTGTTMLVSAIDGSSQVGDGRSSRPSISADGNRVEFISDSDDLVTGDLNIRSDSFVRDLTTSQTILASRADGVNGAQADSGTFSAALSGDGRHVAFETGADNLGDGDIENFEDVHVRDLDTGATRLASVSNDGANGNENAEDPAINADGSRVAFDSEDNLGAPGFPDGATQVWVRDLAAGRTILASRADGPAGAPGSDDSDFPVLSADGSKVAFESEGELLPGLPENSTQAVLRDLGSGTTKLVSRGTGPGGRPIQNFAFADGITADGACVTFEANEPLLGPVPGGTDFDQVFLRAFATDCGRPALPGAGSPPVRDTAAPVLRSVRLTRTRFRATRASSAAVGSRVKRIGRGTELRFTTNEGGRLTVLIERARPGRKVGKGRKRRCKVVSHKRRHGGCTAFRRATTIRRNVKAGRGHVKITGRLHHHRMPAGRYRLTVSERDRAGNISRGIRRNFTILPG